MVTQFLNLAYGPAMGIYLIGLGFVKGYVSEELKDVFNLKNTKDLYEENRCKASLMDLLSLLLIFVNSYVIDYEPFTFFEFIYLFFIMLLVYRFLFWGTTRTVDKLL